MTVLAGRSRRGLPRCAWWRRGARPAGTARTARSQSGPAGPFRPPHSRVALMIRTLRPSRHDGVTGASGGQEIALAQRTGELRPAFAPRFPGSTWHRDVGRCEDRGNGCCAISARLRASMGMWRPVAERPSIAAEVTLPGRTWGTRPRRRAAADRHEARDLGGPIYGRLPRAAGTAAATCARAAWTVCQMTVAAVRRAAARQRLCAVLSCLVGRPWSSRPGQDRRHGHAGEVRRSRT